MAVHNNCGHISSLQANQEEVVAYFQSIKQCLSYYSVLEDDEYAFFVETVAVFQDGGVLGAAPAA